METVDPQYKSKDGNALRIWRDAAKSPFMSEKLGRPVFDEVTYVEVISPGSRDSTPVFEARREFPDIEGVPKRDTLYGIKWEEFREYIEHFDKSENSTQSMGGTPLSEWKEMPRTLCAALKAQNIFTVDALAQLPDSRLMAVGPDGRTWRTKAQAYIDAALHFGTNTQMAAELERYKGENADLKQGLADLSAQFAAFTASQTGGALQGNPLGAQAAVDPLASVVAQAPAVDPLAGAPGAVQAASEHLV